MSNSSPANTADPRQGWLLGGTILLLIVVGTLVCFLIPRRSPPPTAAGPVGDDPRLAYQGPLRNIHPSVGYVGDDACAACHRDQTEPYSHHPMAHTSSAIADIAESEKIDSPRHNPFEAEGERFLVHRAGKRMWHREMRLDASGAPLWAFDREVHFVIGSGARSRSYVTSSDGHLFQSPVSWFTRKQIWDRSPGFTSDELVGRPVLPGCLFCHSNRGHHHEGSVNRYDAPILTGHGIGCERCHGPGELHKESTDKLDIVSPKRLTPASRDAVCEQCHLSGQARILRRGRGQYDFRPGLPLEEFFAIFISPEDLSGDRGAAGGPEHLSKAVNHVEQMHVSRCYQGRTGDDRMGCTSCHDPHRVPAPEVRVAFYRNRCLACHEKRGCSAAAADRKARNDSCIECHMPRVKTADVAHSAATDHRVLRKPAVSQGATGPADLPAKYLPLISFHRGPVHLDDPEQARDLGLALEHLLGQVKLPPRAVAPHAIRLLEDAIGNHPDDLAAYEGKARALMLLNHRSEALATAESILEQQPVHEVALMLAGRLSQELGDADKAIGYWRRAVAANPWLPMYRANLTTLLQHQGLAEEAREHADKWLRQDPGSVPARQAWITCLLHEGKKAEARREFHIIEAMQPPDLEGLRAWFDKGMR